MYHTLCMVHLGRAASRPLGSSIDTVIIRSGHASGPIEQRVTLLWRGEGPDDLPRRGLDNGPVRPYTG